MGLLEAMLKLLVYNVTTFKEIIPNLCFGLLTGLVSSALLYRLSRVDQNYIKFKFKNFVFLLTFLSVGVVVTSPLQAGKYEWLKMVSMFLGLVCLSVCSYTDSKTGTVIVGYVFAGLLSQLIPLMIHISNGGVKLYGDGKKYFIILVILILVFYMIRGFTLIDLGLFYMNLMCILIVFEQYQFLYGGLMIFVAFMSSVVRDVIFKIPKWVKGGKQGSLRFPFTSHILFGMMAVLFFV